MRESKVLTPIPYLGRKKSMIIDGINELTSDGFPGIGESHKLHPIGELSIPAWNKNVTGAPISEDELVGRIEQIKQRYDLAKRQHLITQSKLDEILKSVAGENYIITYTTRGIFAMKGRLYYLTVTGLNGFQTKLKKDFGL